MTVFQKFWIALALLIAFIVVRKGMDFDRLARIGAGYKAKITCSEVFVAGRNKDDIRSQEFENIDPYLKLISTSINEERQSVSATAFGLGRVQAVYRDGYGCTLANGGRISPLPAPGERHSGSIFPRATQKSTKQLDNVNYALLERAITKAFEPDFEKDEVDTNTRAMIVVVDGNIVAERYADGFDAQTPMLGWSMAKSIIGSILAIAVKDGFINIEDPAPYPGWLPEDTRARTTWLNLVPVSYTHLTLPTIYSV